MEFYLRRFLSAMKKRVISIIKDVGIFFVLKSLNIKLGSSLMPVELRIILE